MFENDALRVLQQYHIPQTSSGETQVVRLARCVSMLFDFWFKPEYITVKNLTRVARESGAQMILVILPDSAAHIYREVKRFGDVTEGVPTQCVVRPTFKFALNCDQG